MKRVILHISIQVVIRLNRDQVRALYSIIVEKEIGRRGQC